jgi:hypothetical protein
MAQPAEEVVLRFRDWLFDALAWEPRLTEVARGDDWIRLQLDDARSLVVTVQVDRVIEDWDRLVADGFEFVAGPDATPSSTTDPVNGPVVMLETFVAGALSVVPRDPGVYRIYYQGLDWIPPWRDLRPERSELR